MGQSDPPFTFRVTSVKGANGSAQTVGAGERATLGRIGRMTCACAPAADSVVELTYIQFNKVYRARPDCPTKGFTQQAKPE